MADRHRIGTFNTGGRFTTLLDLNDLASFAVIRGTFDITPFEETAIYARSQRPYGGAFKVGETHDNGLLKGTWMVGMTAGTADATLALKDTLLALLETDRRDLFYEFRPDGASRSAYYQVRGSAPWKPKWDWAAFAGAQCIEIDLAWQVAPAAYGDPMDIFDDFTVDTITDYTFTAGAGTLSVSGGQLVPSTTAVKNLTHSARGYTVSDAQETLKWTTGTTPASADHQLKLRWLDDNNYLVARVVSGNTLQIGKWDVGAFTSLGSGAVTALVASTTYWLRFRSERNVLTAELWTAEPTPLGTPANTPVTVTLSGADATKFGNSIAGGYGFRLVPGDTGERYDDYRFEPYTYVRSGTQTLAAHEFELPGIPGTAPALVDITTAVLDSGSGAAGPMGAIIGWDQPQGVENLVWNGDFEGDSSTSGWATAAAPGGLSAAATSIAALSTVAGTAAAKFGTVSGEIVTPATNLAGVHFPIYRRFKKGVTYTIAFYQWAASSTTTVQGGVGVSGDISFTTPTALTTTPTLKTVTWTPTADRDVAYLVLQQTAATASTFRIDGVMVYKGTTAPSTGKQAEGAGALAPFGLIEAEYSNPTSGFLTSDATQSAGNKLSRPGVTQFGSSVTVDPSLIQSDDFQQSVAVEVWAIVTAPNGNTVTITAQANPHDTSQLGGTVAIFTVEYGGTGRTFTGNAGRQLIRVGTIILPKDGGRWDLGVTLSGANGTYAHDALILVPAMRRATTATHKPAADVAAFIVGGVANAQWTKRVNSDLTATLARDRSSPGQSFGLLGTPIEMQPGTGRVIHKLHQDVIDPSDATRTDALAASACAVRFSVWPRYHLARAS